MILFFATKVLLFFETTKQTGKNIKYNSYFCLFRAKTKVYLWFCVKNGILGKRANGEEKARQDEVYYFVGYKKRGTRSVECRAREGVLGL